jgi:hypothetical protein
MNILFATRKIEEKWIYAQKMMLSNGPLKIPRSQQCSFFEGVDVLFIFFVFLSMMVSNPISMSGDVS